jgi:hypothetical protein
MRTILSTNDLGSTLAQPEGRHRVDYLYQLLSNEFVSEPKLQLGVPRLPEVARPYRRKQMSKAEQKVNHTNPGKKEEYHGKHLGHTKGAPEEDKAVFSGKDSRVCPHETTGPNVGATVSSQAPSLPGASPNRIRHSEPKVISEHGTTRLAHVTNIPKKEVDERAAADADKVKLFSRPSSGNSDALPRPEMHGRDWNQTDAPAPNRKES